MTLLSFKGIFFLIFPNHPTVYSKINSLMNVATSFWLHTYNIKVIHGASLTHSYRPLRFSNQFLPTVPTFAVRETDVSRHNGRTSGDPLKPLRVDSALRALSTLRGLRGAPEVPPLCRETQSLGQQMLELSCENATVGTHGLTKLRFRFFRPQNDKSLLINWKILFQTGKTTAIGLSKGLTISRHHGGPSEIPRTS